MLQNVNINTNSKNTKDTYDTSIVKNSYICILKCQNDIK